MTIIGFPLVRTPMIAPTLAYGERSALPPQRAVQWILAAVRDRPVEMYPSYAGTLRFISALSPRMADALVRNAGI
ncbi:hypothetical protein [Nocardia sp. NPDC003963]